MTPGVEFGAIEVVVTAFVLLLASFAADTADMLVTNVIIMPALCVACVDVAVATVLSAEYVDTLFVVVDVPEFLCGIGVLSLFDESAVSLSRLIVVVFMFCCVCDSSAASVE